MARRGGRTLLCAPPSRQHVSALPQCAYHVLQVMADSTYNSPARSVGEPASLTESENESDSVDLVTEVPGAPEQTIIDGWLKFRDLKKVTFQRILHLL